MGTSASKAKGEFTDWHAIAAPLAQGVARSQPAARPRIVGIAGSQGSGKSTLARIVVEHFREQGISATSVSLDDFYLTQAERVALAEAVHPLLRTRGVPGTHDTGWLGRVVTSMQGQDGQQKVELQLPQFDKGRDDRAGQRNVSCELLVLEGWCLGVSAQPAGQLREPINALERQEDGDGVWRTWVNEQIALHYQPLWQQIDYWLQLRPPSFAQVVQWRGEQEQQIAPAQRMDALALQRFIDHYQRLTQWQWDGPVLGPGLAVSLGADHCVSKVVEVSLETTDSG